MDTFKFNYNHPIKMELENHERLYQVRVLDSLPDALLVRVPDELTAEDVPEKVRIGFGQKHYYYYADVAVQAFYSQAWFLDFPDPATAQKIQRRKFVRIRLQASLIAMECDAYGEPAGSPIELEIENVSASGCLAIVERENVSDFLMIFLDLLELSGATVIGRVMHRRPLPDGRLALGIAFDNISPQMQDVLAQRINKEIQTNLNQGIDVSV